ncbi:hypothetical protein FM117_09750 [Micrococcus luteus Mu201]|nr:hypothetical protein FM117_09750 [Micrococcus luteus Mu201]
MEPRVSGDGALVLPRDPRGEWEHLRYALRDLDALDDAAAQGR